MKKLLKNKKALSPVVAAIILIAVTVAVSIAVAAWMGALTFTFMSTEPVDIRSITWTWNSTPANRSFTVTIYNTGTSSVTITQIWVNNVDKTDDSTIPKDSGLTIDAGGSNSITVTYPYNNGTNYQITVVTSKGNKFSKWFVGGSPS